MRAHQFHEAVAGVVSGGANVEAGLFQLIGREGRQGQLHDFTPHPDRTDRSERLQPRVGLEDGGGKDGPESGGFVWTALPSRPIDIGVVDVSAGAVAEQRKHARPFVEREGPRQRTRIIR